MGNERSPGDWTDWHAWGVRYQEQLAARVKAELAAEAAAQAARKRELELELEQQRVEAAIPRPCGDSLND